MSFADATDSSDLPPFSGYGRFFSPLLGFGPADLSECGLILSYTTSSTERMFPYILAKQVHGLVPQK
ncbi:hypothetical protein TgHK011_005506 [Trichoderma gracile]|nr:hypothetical protein TgHK011_005506 [Trichoderma gracile]